MSNYIENITGLINKIDNDIINFDNESLKKPFSLDEKRFLRQLLRDCLAVNFKMDEILKENDYPNDCLKNLYPLVGQLHVIEETINGTKLGAGDLNKFIRFLSAKYEFDIIEEAEEFRKGEKSCSQSS